MVEDAYTNVQSKMKINDFLSCPFNLTRGVCHGCLFSMLLYTITAEVLASFIDANKKIKGILIGDHENKIVNSADETTIFLRGIITCLNRIQVILSWYEDASSPKIKKSSLMGSCIWKWNWSTRTNKMIKISIKTLEVNFGNPILDNSKWQNNWNYNKKNIWDS